MYIYVNLFIYVMCICVFHGAKETALEISGTSNFTPYKNVYVAWLNNWLFKNSNYHYFLNDICSLFKMLKDGENYQNVRKIMLQHFSSLEITKYLSIHFKRQVR